MDLKIKEGFNIQIKKNDPQKEGEKIKIKALLHFVTFEKSEDVKNI